MYLVHVVIQWRWWQNLLAEHHQFLRDADDESDNSYGARVARKYYDSLYKEVREA